MPNPPQTPPPPYRTTPVADGEMTLEFSPFWKAALERLKTREKHHLLQLLRRNRLLDHLRLVSNQGFLYLVQLLEAAQARPDLADLTVEEGIRLTLQQYVDPVDASPDPEQKPPALTPDEEKELSRRLRAFQNKTRKGLIAHYQTPPLEPKSARQTSESDQTTPSPQEA